ncbi:hypothetical protein ACUH9X_08300 [Dermabacteraceae bacterium P13147]
MLKDLALALLTGVGVVALAEILLALSTRLGRGRWPHQPTKLEAEVEAEVDEYIERHYGIQMKQVEQIERSEAFKARAALEARKKHPILDRLMSPLPPSCSPIYGKAPRNKIVGLAEKYSSWALGVLVLFVAMPANAVMVGAAVLNIHIPDFWIYAYFGTFSVLSMMLMYLRVRDAERCGVGLSELSKIPPTVGFYVPHLLITSVWCMLAVTVLKIVVGIVTRV